MPESKAPTLTSDHALSQLRYIRSAMDGATRFTAVPGRGIALIGVSALVAAVFARLQAAVEAVLLVWSAEAVVAISIGLIALYLKTKPAGINLASGPARKFMLALVPSGVCAAALSLALAIHEQMWLIPPVWLMGYGTAVIAAGAHSVAAVPIMGGLFVLLGLVALIVAPEHHNTLLAIAFGGIHVGFGIFIARRHGG